MQTIPQDVQNLLNRYLILDSDLNDLITFDQDQILIFASQQDVRAKKILSRIPWPPQHSSRSKRTLRVAIDPGHLGGNYARVEHRHMIISAANQQSLLVKEGDLTLKTALYLKKMLTELGCEVLMTRDQLGKPVFHQDFKSWSQRQALQDERVLWTQFNRLDLLARADLINQFRPDVTCIIHYNTAGSSNADGVFPTHGRNNYCMVFIPGAFSTDQGLFPYHQLGAFERLLKTDHLVVSHKMAEHFINLTIKELGVPTVGDDEPFANSVYLNEHCKKVAPGIYCRNLALCHLVASPLIYGESQCMDNWQEANLLVHSDESRLKQVAKIYAETVMSIVG